jgi:gamma-glutamylcyclotransferase (GGCT)/AIG2-like uncharacterized protein YtfP
MNSTIEISDGLLDVLVKINADRLEISTKENSEWVRIAEEIIESLFSPSNKLAVYGTLAPGEPHESILKPIRGTWYDGFVRGYLHDSEWDTEIDYQGLIWDPEGDSIPVKVLLSENLPAEWARLDEFEGEEYARILAPVENQHGLFAVANIYAFYDEMVSAYKDSS